MPVASFENEENDVDFLEIVVPNPSSYLPQLGAFPRVPRPSLSLVSSALEQLRVLYVDNNHHHGNDLPGNTCNRKIKKYSVEIAWEEEIERVRVDKFEYDWSQKWLMNWISYGFSWLEDLKTPLSAEQEEEEMIAAQDSISATSHCSDIHNLVDDIHQEQIKTIENLIESASSIVSACGGTTASGAVERKFRFDYKDEDEQIVIKLRDESLNDYDSVGVQTWASAVLLSSDICKRPDYFGLVPPASLPSTPLKVLELGAGTGLLGLTSTKVLDKTYSIFKDSKQEAPQVIMTDYHPLVLDNLKHNLVFNDLNCDLTSPGHYRSLADVGIKPLDWKQYFDAESGNAWREYVPQHSADGEENEDLFDVILGADIVYAPEHAAWIASTIRSLLKRPTSSQVYTPSEPSFHLIFALRLSHYEELNIIRQVFDANRWPDNLKEGEQKNKWNIVIVEERLIERTDRNLGRADEIEYFAWRLAWRPVPARSS